MKEKNRKYYEVLFQNYDDVVNLNTLREMLGGVSESYIRMLLQQDIIQSFKIDGLGYMVRKQYVIDFILSSRYQNNMQLKTKI